MKTIGIVCEGPRDYDMITSVIMSFMEQEYIFLPLQPNMEFGMELGAGWKGVWHWCQTHSDHLAEFLSGITPAIDLLIVQMDADVARCEREAYCETIDIQCPAKETERFLSCKTAIDGRCEIPLPPNMQCDGSVQSRVDYLTGLLAGYLRSSGTPPIVITIPCDSTDAWILAAFESQMQQIEDFPSPWHFISKSKTYHGIRISGHGKSRRTYLTLVEQVCRQWYQVTAACTQACVFERNVYAALQ